MRHDSNFLTSKTNEIIFSLVKHVSVLVTNVIGSKYHNFLVEGRKKIFQILSNNFFLAKTCNRHVSSSGKNRTDESEEKRSVGDIAKSPRSYFLYR